MSQVYLAEHRDSTNWGDRKSNQILVFGERGEPEYLSEQSREPTNSTHPHMTSDPGFEPGPHWWKASALTTAPSLLSDKRTRVDVVFDHCPQNFIKAGKEA